MSTERTLKNKIKNKLKIIKIGYSVNAPDLCINHWADGSHLEFYKFSMLNISVVFFHVDFLYFFVMWTLLYFFYSDHLFVYSLYTLIV